MMFEINDMDTVGQVNDVKPHLLPPEAFTVLTNVRFRDNGIEVTLGWEACMVPAAGSRLFAPHFVLPLVTTSQTYWLYFSLTKGVVFDGVNDIDITRAAGDYNAIETRDWNGCILGGIPIVNNGTDVPQFWTLPTSNKTQNLTAWTATSRAKIVRAYKNFLVAFNITDSGTRKPHLVWWSHPADPGALPISWDYTDPTKDAGRNDLPDTGNGEIQEAMMLSDTMFIYKEQSVWKMKFVGGRFIMDFGTGPWLDGIGILGPRCVAVFDKGTKQCFASQDDILAHNGNQIESILLGRQRESLFAGLNSETAKNSFMFNNSLKSEIWFCYPETGQDQPNRALVWNYRKGKGAISYVDGITFRNVAVGNIEGTNPEIWDFGSDLWDDDTGAWSEFFRNQLVAADPTALKLFQLDKSNTKNGTIFTPVMIRESLGVFGKKRGGEWITDIQAFKFVDSIWPKASGFPFRARVGFQQSINDPVVWQPYVDFDPASQRYVNPFVDEELPGSGPLYSIEFSGTNGAQWRLDGYKLDVNKIGNF